MWPNLMQNQVVMQPRPMASNTTNIYNNFFYPQPTPYVQPQPVMPQLFMQQPIMAQPFMPQPIMQQPTPQPIASNFSGQTINPGFGFPTIHQGSFGQTIGGGFPFPAVPNQTPSFPGLPVNNTFMPKNYSMNNILSDIWNSILKNAGIINGTNPNLPVNPAEETIVEDNVPTPTTANPAEELVVEDNVPATATNTPAEEIVVEDNAPANNEVHVKDNKKGMHGDPHINFTDGSGKDVTINHKGKNGKTYHVLNANGLDIDAEYKATKNKKNPQVMGAVRVKAGKEKLVLNNGNVKLNGKKLKQGRTKLDDGRVLNVKKDGSVVIKDKNSKVNINKKGGRYDIDPSGKLDISNKKNGGILGFLTSLGQNKGLTKEQILKKYDTNGNGMLDSGDKKLEKMFKAKDIGFHGRK